MNGMPFAEKRKEEEGEDRMFWNCKRQRDELTRLYGHAFIEWHFFPKIEK